MNNGNILSEFYTHFKNRDYLAMSRCYHPEVEFSDPVFPNLKGKEVSAMWHMLVSKGKETKISFSNIEIFENTGSCNWEAIYPYGPKRRMVHNVVKSTFTFKDGKILKQTDSFDLWKWLGMALGPVGTFLGWSAFLKRKVRKLAAHNLQDFMNSNPEYRN